MRNGWTATAGEDFIEIASNQSVIDLLHAEIAEGTYVGYSRHKKSTDFHSRSCNPKDAGSNASRERGLETIQAPQDAGANSRGAE